MGNKTDVGLIKWKTNEKLTCVKYLNICKTLKAFFRGKKVRNLCCTLPYIL